MRKGTDIMTFLDGRKVVSYDAIVSVREAIDNKKSCLLYTSDAADD